MRFSREPGYDDTIKLVFLIVTSLLDYEYRPPYAPKSSFKLVEGKRRFETAPRVLNRLAHENYFFKMAANGHLQCAL